jgi:1-pyrroline-5-carboxylate dehydrogenase
MLSGYYIIKLLEAAGFPPGVINFVPATPVEISNIPARFTGPRRDSLHRQHQRVPVDVVTRRAEHCRATGAIRAWSEKPAAKDFIVAHPSADVQEFAVAIVAGRVRVPGAEMLGGQPHLRAEVAVAGGQGSRGRDDARYPDGRRSRLPDLHGRGDRSQVIREDSGYLDDARKNATIIEGGKAGGRRRLLYLADAGPGAGARATG